MKEKQIYLVNGDLLIRSAEGVYSRQDIGMSVPVIIDREEGEYLLFETCNQLKMTLESLKVENKSNVTFNSKKENADAIICPHCEYVYGNYDDYIEVGDMSGEFSMDCEKCGEGFKIDFYSIFWFKTER